MYEVEKKELVAICKLLYDRNLVTASDGNISVRINDAHLLITPSGKNKGFLEPEEIIVIDMEGNVVEGKGKASREYPMHRTIYTERSDVNAVVHTHPVYATAFAMTGQNIPDHYLIESRVALGKTGLAAYAPAGSAQLAENIRPFVKDCNAVLLMNHGAITYGENLMSAYNKMEVLETVAKTIIVSKNIGTPVPIPD
jgi:L-fuculose-phosphate aldolase